MYILECANGCYYTGSTNDLECRLKQHQNGEGVNFTKKHLPVKLVYFEKFQRIDHAFNREKQVQGWNRKKKEALINGFHDRLPELSLAYRDIVPVAEVLEATIATAFPSRASGNGLPVVEVLETTETTRWLREPQPPNNVQPRNPQI